MEHDLLDTPPCQLRPNKYCPVHYRKHTGREYLLSQMEKEPGIKYRRHWDKLIKIQRWPEEIDLPHFSKNISSPLLSPHPRLFNNSIIRYRGKLYMVYRVSYFYSTLSLCELDENFEVIWNKKVNIQTSIFDSCAQEDPRFFIFRDELYFSYIGLISRENGTSVIASQMLAKLDENLEVEKTWYLSFSQRNTHEKNWQFFEYEGELYCIYWIVPHVILKIDLEKSTAKYLTETHWIVPKEWKFAGFLRGGANPVLFQDECYSFFHWVYDPPQPMIKTYALGVYTFENRFPFPVSRISKASLLVNKDDTRPEDWPVNVTFPCGAFINKNDWVISYGTHDTYPSVGLWPVSSIESCLVPVESDPQLHPPFFSM